MNRYYIVSNPFTVSRFLSTSRRAPEYGANFYRRNTEEIELPRGTEIHSLEGGDFVILEDGAYAVKRIPRERLYYGANELPSGARTFVSDYRANNP